jgi:hypothetical protein
MEINLICVCLRLTRIFETTGLNLFANSLKLTEVTRVSHLENQSKTFLPVGVTVPTVNQKLIWTSSKKISKTYQRTSK